MSETTELSTTGAAPGVPAHRTEAAERFAQTLQMVREAMFNTDVDAAKAKVMSDLMTGLEDRALDAEFNRDLNSAIMEMPVITRAGIIVIPARDGNPERTQGRFARYEDIDRVVRPILIRHNLSIRFDIGEAGGKVSVRPIIGHRNGRTFRGEAMTAPLDTSGAKNNVQGAGSTVTYLKRYTMCAALNIVTEGTDDDGSLGRFEIGMTNEREVQVLAEAEEAAENGTYATWFPGQGHKDRMWLVKAGHHARLGGGLLLPGAEAPETIERPSAGGSGGAASPSRGPARRGNGGASEITAEDWTRSYEERCRNAKTLDALQQVQERGRDSMNRLRGADQALYERAVQAGTDALARISGGDL